MIGPWQSFSEAWYFLTDFIMQKLLLHALTFERLNDRLKKFQKEICPITIDESEQLMEPWSKQSIETVSPQLCYAEPTVFFGTSIRKFLPLVLSSDKLRWVHSTAAGIEHPVLVKLGQKAEIYTQSHIQSEAMSEWAIWLALDFFRKGTVRREDNRQGIWKRRESTEIANSRWLIYGFGAIGEAVGRRVRALGGYVTGVRRTKFESENADKIITPEEVLTELGEANVVLLCVPHTSQTENMANKNFFEQMNSKALFLNLGRGALVVEEDLIDALDDGKLAFAGLDVVREEPLPSDHSLWKHEKVMITPHDSAHTSGTADRFDDEFIKNLERWCSGQKLKNIVPRQLFLEQ